VILIVYGPAGSGKTRNAEKLMRHFGCTRIVDEWDGKRPLVDGDVALTQSAPGAFSKTPGARIMTVTDAVAAVTVVEAQR
jgi:hypothetical protein